MSQLILERGLDMNTVQNWVYVHRTLQDICHLKYACYSQLKISNICSSDAWQNQFKTFPSRSAILFGYKVVKARLHSDSRESAGTSYVMHSKFLSSTSRWFQRRFLVHLSVLFNFKKEFLRMIGWQNTRNALGKLEELLTCKIWWVFPAWGFVYFLK